MNDILYIQEYYYYLIAFISVLTLISLSSYLKDKSLERLMTIIIVPFSLFTFYYIGSRSVDIGVDTFRYENAFEFYESSKGFEIRKDPFYDFLTFVFSKAFDFQTLLLFCAFLYVFGALYGFRKIFKKNYYLPFLVFLISPYFFNAGINVMRSGVAASLFLIGLGIYCDKGKIWKVALFFLLSVAFHFSMFVPLFFFFLTRFIKNTETIFFAWLISIVLGVLKINIILTLVDAIGVFSSRTGNYAVNEAEQSSWLNFVIFGFFPVLFAVYNILILKYKDDFYKWLVNAYMLIHIPYIILINNQFASRLGYLAEFMMPIILLYPLLIDPKLKIKYSRLKLCLLILCVFLLKAIKVLIV